MTGPISDGDARAHPLRRRVRRRRHHGRRGPHRGGQRGRRADLRPQRRGDGRPGSRRAADPEDLREPHRHGLAKYVATGSGRVVDHPVEMPALRADGTEFPVELAIRRLPVPAPPEPPLFLGVLRDITERCAPRTSCASSPPSRRRCTGSRPSYARACRSRGRRRGHQEIGPAGRRDLKRHPLRQRRLGQRARRLERAGRQQCAGRLDVRIEDADTVAARIYRTKQPARLDSYEGHDSELANMLRELGFRCVGRRADLRRGRAVGRARWCRASSRSRSRAGVEHRIAALRRADRPGARQRRGARRARARRAPASSRRPTPRAGASSATCTTAPSSGSSRSR